MMTSLREHLRLPQVRGRTRVVTLLVGLVVGGGGIALTLWAGLGLGPYDVLIHGVSQQLGTTFGIASMLTSSVVVAAGWRLGGPVGPGTIAGMLGIGPAVDGWTWVLPEATPALWWTQTAGLLAGLVVLAFGLSLVVASDLGAAPVEVLMLGLSGRGLSLAWVRTLLEVTMAVTGFAIGGMLGVGTVVIALAIGHLMALFLPAASRPDVGTGRGSDGPTGSG